MLGLDPAAVEVAHREGRAPRLVRPRGSGLHLSSASRGGVAVVAVAEAPVGVDVERVEPGAAIPWNVLHPDEAAALRRAADAPRAFARLWALKEAHLKALGTGLSREPASFAVRPEPVSAVADAEGPPVDAVVIDEDTASGAVAVALVVRRGEP